MNTPLQYPGNTPGSGTRAVSDSLLLLENAIVQCKWILDSGVICGLRITNRHTGQSISLESGHMPSVNIRGAGPIDISSMQAVASPRLVDSSVVVDFREDETGLDFQWSATLDDDANAVVQGLRITATQETRIEEVTFIDAEMAGARQVGEVDGSVVVCVDIFMAVEHPMADNVVYDSIARCGLQHDVFLEASESFSLTFAIGVAAPSQLRRSFLYYLERRRACPYRPFLHYNNWYEVWLGRPVERMTEAEALDAIEYFGKELVRQRGVTMDAFAWDDGWDDCDTLWDFHCGFPDGFRNLQEAAGKYGARQGVWMSPNGGYATAKEKRIKHGEPLGYETNERGFAMGGPHYARAFKEVCVKMIRDNGVVFFKFDGMGEGGAPDGASGAYADDIVAILELSRSLHEEKPDVYVSATCGTWASPFWLISADSVWRQGGDSGHHGKGDTRQQWITYRDMFCYERVVQAGPLYPLNSIMLHGILIGNRPNRAPSGMVLDERSVADEIWSFFGSGTCLQELYVSPGVPTDTMLDQLAGAARWARENSGTLIDTHWVGGNPGKEEVYGRASWQPGKGILSLRNPSDVEQPFRMIPREALELPDGADGVFSLAVVYPKERKLPVDRIGASEALDLDMAPFETLVVELTS